MHATTSANHTPTTLRGSAVAALACALLATYMATLPMATADPLLAFSLLGCIVAAGLFAVAATSTPRAVPVLALLVILAGGWQCARLWQPHAAAQSVRQDPPGSQQRIHLNIRQQGNWGSAYLHTQEAFADYWAQLKSGGVLLVQTSDERLYMRALLTAWEVLQAQPASGSDRLVEQGWGYRIPAAHGGAPSFHLLLAKGPLGDSMAQQARAWAEKNQAIPLFGPGVFPAASYDVRVDPYNILYHPEGLMIARMAFSDAAAWHLQAPVEMAPASDDRPFFHRVTTSLPPLPKLLIAGALGALALVLLFPLARLRGAGSTLPPLPAYLGHGALLAACATGALVALAFQSGRFIGNSGLALAAAWLGMLGGAGIGAMAGEKCACRFPGRSALAGAALFALMPWLLGHAGIATQLPPALRAAMVALPALLTGALCAALFRSAQQAIPAELSALRPWTWVAAGLSAIASATGSVWLAQELGWTRVWLTGAAGFAAVFLLGVWLRWPLRHPVEAPADGGLKGI